MKKTAIAIFGCLLVALSLQVNAATWNFNGHTYEYVSTDGWVPWSEAAGMAEAMGGYLATLTSEEENQWVYDNVVVPANLASEHQAWLGGYRENVGDWKWVTGETWDYTKWGPGEPNNAGGVEYGMTIHRYNDATWNDEGAWQDGISGFIVEKSAKVPDGGFTALLLGMTLSSLGFIRRR